MKTLYIIPARGGSKGIPNKNIKELGGKPLIHYSLEFARLFTSDDNICLSTNSVKIANCALKINYKVPFLRPNYLSTDISRTYEVLQHALSFYQKKGLQYESIILLQPTSPFREKYHLEEARSLYSSNLDMVVSVKESHSNPYYNLFEEMENGYLKICKGDGNFSRRQDMPPVYEYNGSIYIINALSLLNKTSFKDFQMVKKYIMAPEYSIDIDSQADWNLAQFMFEKR